MNTGRIRASLLLVLVLVGTGGCAGGGGGGGGGYPASTSAATQSATPSTALAIAIKDFAYGTPLTVAPGATVTVTNMDTAGHTVTADEGSAFDADVKGSGGTATFTAPTKPGTYAYHCTYHPSMHGTLTVK
ncbi:cupredoxin domain-containing protein [Pseudarthrobacter sp. S9]|uniref:cupredoxin domain-containing protein n=1 Tax=Pseudarthrobacter sp. S9 TaxID=3418421 RepID=UPI003D090E4F